MVDQTVSYQNASPDSASLNQTSQKNYKFPATSGAVSEMKFEPSDQMLFLSGLKNIVSSSTRRVKNVFIATLNVLPLPVANSISGLIYCLLPHRLNILPSIARAWLQYKFSPTIAPMPKLTGTPIGFCGIVGNPDTDQLLRGYQEGFYPFSHLGPVKWFASDERMVMFFDEAHAEKHTRRFLRNDRFRVTMDTAFETVMMECAAPRPDKAPLTWITSQTRKLFMQLFEAGHAHSVEVWDKEDNLVGGLFGVASGRVFFTESQFHLASGASKVAFAVLNRHLGHWGYAMNDGKDWTPYLKAHGFRLVNHDKFQDILRQHAKQPMRVGKWQLDDDLQWQNWQGEMECQYSGTLLAPFRPGP